MFFVQQGIRFTEIGHILRIFASTRIWYHTHKERHKAHTGAKWLNHPYKYILTPSAMYSQQLSMFHWINSCWYQKLTSHFSTMYLLFKKYSLVEVAYLLIRFNKTRFFPRNTKNTDRYDVNKENTKQNTPHSAKDMIGKGWLQSPPFLISLIPYFTYHEEL